MNYSLAKELKDAGFPFPAPIIGDEFWKLPTLSELIEACGNGFNDLRSPYDCVNNEGKYVMSGCKEGWKAMGSPYVIDVQHEIIDEGHWPIGIGTTPDEAVARLWLVLNKK